MKMPVPVLIMAYFKDLNLRIALPYKGTLNGVHSNGQFEGSLPMSSLKVKHG